LNVRGVTVRVTPVAELHAQPFTVLGWPVDDIRTSITELATRGVEFLQARRLSGCPSPPYL